MFIRFATTAIAAGMLLASPAAVAQIAGAPKRSPDSAPAKSCATAECHTGIVKHTVLHNPTAADCTACHVGVGDAKDHKFSYPVAKEELCLKCHQLPLDKHPHAPVRDGKCLDCHDPHGSEHKAQLIADPNRDLCTKCHAATTAGKKFVHGPAAVGACTTCHKWHSSDLPNLLSADPNTLCTTCHADTAKAGDGMHVHKALEQGCTNCHDPHATDHKFQLTADAPELCLSCHKEKFDRITSGASVVHGAVTDAGGCTSCHEPHASKLAALQKGVQPDSCLKCHDKQLKATDGTMLADMSKLLATNSEKHGPIRSGHCTVCHDPHASQNFRLLPAAYPGTFYSPFNEDLYKLCFQCHTSDMVKKAEGAGVTQFRDGNKNLHALHVNQEKGRTCRACHEVHASRRPSHVRESVPFGSSSWMLEINYQASEEGGSCSPGCHATKKYTRPAANLPAPKDQRDVTPPAATQAAPPATKTGQADAPRTGGRDTAPPQAGQAGPETPR